MDVGLCCKEGGVGVCRELAGGVVSTDVGAFIDDGEGYGEYPFGFSTSPRMIAGGFGDFDVFDRVDIGVCSVAFGVLDFERVARGESS